MIRDTSAQDRPLSTTPVPRWRRWLWPAAGGAAVLAIVAWVASGWAAGSRSYDASRLRIAEVKRGDLVRDIVADGRVITANSPVLYAVAGGTVALKVVAGDAVEKGQVLAVIDSPELRSKLVQEESTLASMEAEASRAQLDARIARLNARKAREQAQIEHTAALRDLERMERGHAGGAVSNNELARARDALEKARIGLETSAGALRRPALPFAVPVTGRLSRRRPPPPSARPPARPGAARAGCCRPRCWPGPARCSRPPAGPG